MKRLLIIIIAISLLTSCANWLDVNSDPNYPTEVGTDLILPAAQASLAVRLGGNLFNVGGFFAQYWSQAPEANQYNTVETFDLRTDFLNNDYTELFAGGLNDLETIRNQSMAEEDWGNYLAATVLRAYIFQMWVDMVDKIPYVEALQGTAVVNPKWDDGSAVYSGLIDEIDNALSQITSESTVAPSDLMLAGDISQWVGFANAMKLKLLMRESMKTDVTAKVKSLLSENNFMTVDVAFDAFSNEVGKRNPWYETTKDLNTDANHVGTVNIIRYYSVNNDPRIASIFNVAENTDTYEGIYPALKNVEQGHLTSDYSRPYLSATAPVFIYTLFELELFKAEAQLLINNDKGAAKLAYETAIDKALEVHGLSADPSLYADGASYFFDVSKSNDQLFEQIMMQKWASLCAVNNFESWCEIRRTDFPKYFGNRSDFGDGTSYIPGQMLDPAKNLLSDGVHFPNRLPYPDVAVSRNSNTPALNSRDSFENKVWWDVK